MRSAAIFFLALTVTFVLGCLFTPQHRPLSPPVHRVEVGLVGECNNRADIDNCLAASLKVWAETRR